MPHNHMLRESTGGYNLTEPQGKIDHLMNMYDKNMFAKNENNLVTLTMTLKIFSDNVAMKFGIGKYVMLIMSCRK